MLEYKQPTIRKMLRKEVEFEFKIVNATSPEGVELVRKFNIVAVPTSIVDDQIAFVGVPEKNKALELLKAS